MHIFRAPFYKNSCGGLHASESVTMTSGKKNRNIRKNWNSFSFPGYTFSNQAIYSNWCIEKVKLCFPMIPLFLVCPRFIYSKYFTAVHIQKSKELRCYARKKLINFFLYSSVAISFWKLTYLLNFLDPPLVKLF